MLANLFFVLKSIINGSCSIAMLVYYVYILDMTLYDGI